MKAAATPTPMPPKTQNFRTLNHPPSGNGSGVFSTVCTSHPRHTTGAPGAHGGGGGSPAPELTAPQHLSPPQLPSPDFPDFPDQKSERTAGRGNG